MRLKAVVMAGGEGTRLRPLTCNLPKPMVPVGNRPILEHVLSLLAHHGVEEALLTLHHRPQSIRDFVGDGSSFGLRAKCFVEEVPLGTAGSVKNVEPELDGTFLVLSGDILTDIDLGALLAFHKERGAAVTICLTTVENPLEYGMVVSDRDGRVTRYVEKPSWGQVLSDQVNTGIYVVEPEVLKLIEPGRVWDFSQQLFPALLESGLPLFGYRSRGYWCDVGNLGQYLQAHVDILEGRTGLKVGGTQLQDKVWVGPGVEIAPGVELSGPVLVGSGTYLGTGARLAGPVVLGREVVVAGQASIKRSVVGDHTHVGRLAEVRGAVLGRGVRLGNRSSVYDGAVLADEVHTGDEAVVKPGVKVWPGRAIAPETVLGDSLVWGQTWGWGVFGDAGVTGTVNLELRAELAARLGAVFGASHPLGARLVVGADPAPAARLLRDALVSGIGLAGSEVWNVGEMPAAVVRYATRVLGAAGGVHLGFGASGDEEATAPRAGAGGDASGTATAALPGGAVAIRFFGAGGADIRRAETRALERSLGGEDFRRASPDKLGEVRYLPGLGEAYLAYAEDRGRNLARRGLVLAGAYRHPWLGKQAPGFWRRLDVGHLALEPFSCAGTPALEAIGRRLRETGGAFAFEVDPSGETLRLIDDRGRLLSPAQTWLVLSAATLIRDGTPLVTPSDLPRAVAERLGALGARPVPCRGSRAELMARMREVEEEAGPALFRQSEIMFDGLLAAVALLDYLVDTEQTLAEMVDESPLGEWVRLRVGCPWETKGRVMRLLLESEAGPAAAGVGLPGGEEGLQADTGRGRVLVVPDADRPAFHVYSEAASMEVAEELAGDYARRVRELAGLEDNTGISPSGGQS